MSSEAHIEYRREYVKCGQLGCRKCSGAKGGHGPYWFAYETVDGELRRTYAGKTKPVGATPKRRGKQAL